MKVKLIIDMSRKDERDCFLLSGIKRTNEIELVEDESDADFVFCHRGNPTNSWRPPQLNDQKKLIIFDYTDKPDNVNFDNYGHYFKRSCVKRNGFEKRMIPEMFKDNFHALPYSLKYIDNKDVHDVIDLNNINKSIDISCFFQPNAGGIRTQVLNTVTNYRTGNRNVHTGLSGNNEIRRNGRENFLENYYKKMRKSNIVVTCNHNDWEGDWRLYESLSVGTCVFVDTMLTPLDKEFIDGETIVFYNSINELREKLNFYLERPDLVEKITNKSKEFVYKYHKPEDRIQMVIKKITQ